MNKAEPTLLSHFNEVREEFLAEGGLSSVILLGEIRAETDSVAVISLHRDIVEEEVNNEEVNVTGLLIGQVNRACSRFECT